MTPAIAQKLIALNQQFYQIVAEPFTKTRSYSWTGWLDLLDFFQSRNFLPKTILDLGCGNGRFLTFATEHWTLEKYLGIDASSELLAYAKESYAHLPFVTFKNQDLFTDTNLNEYLGSYELITILGVMHHIPGRDLRVSFLKSAASKLTDDGMLVVTFWDFLSETKLSKKVVPWTLVNIDPKFVEEHDYLLDWKRAATAYRYCHYYNVDEISELASAAGLKVVKQFLADGPGGKANRYVVFNRQ